MWNPLRVTGRKLIYTTGKSIVGYLPPIKYCHLAGARADVFDYIERFYNAKGSVTAGGHIFDPDSDDVAAAKLAVDRQIEQRQVASAFFDLEFRSDRPDLFWPQRRLCPCQLAFVLGYALWRRRGGGYFILHGHPPRLRPPRRRGLPAKALVLGRLSDPPQTLPLASPKAAYSV
jgi:hypothetical protein